MSIFCRVGGVQCIFPWILDETNAKTPYKCTITNGDVFELERGEKQNFLVFKINGQARGEQLEGEVSDGFISVAGYYFNLTLRVNFSKSAHYSTIIFKLSDAQRVELIEEAIRRRSQALEKQYAQREKELDQRARELALREIARTVIAHPEKTGIYKKAHKKTATGDRIIFQADEILSYDDMHIIKIAVENDGRSEPIYINGVQIQKGGSDLKPLVLEYEIAPRVDAGQECEGFVVTRDPRIVDGKDSTMTMLTDKGNVELQW